MSLIRTILVYALEVYSWLILIRVLVSWLPAAGVRLNAHSGVGYYIGQVLRLIHLLTEPILAPLRPFSRMGMMDLSPVIAFFIIQFLKRLFSGQSIANTIAFALAMVVAFSVHEFSHAWVAFRLGDPTAKNQGRLTLDPRKHLDVLGSIMVLVAGFGWARPVPVNPYNLQNGPKAGMAMVAAAGPLSNLVLAIAAALVFRLGVVEAYYSSSVLPNPQELLFVFIWLNVVLLFFNLLPIAPLDGFKVVAGFLPYPTSNSFLKLEPVGPLILLLLVFLGGPLFSGLIITPTNYLVSWLVS